MVKVILSVPEYVKPERSDPETVAVVLQEEVDLLLFVELQMNNLLFTWEQQAVEYGKH